MVTTLIERARIWWESTHPDPCDGGRYCQEQFSQYPCIHDLAAFARTERARVLREAADAMDERRRDPDKLLDPFTVAGTDYRPENMRCLREGLSSATGQAADWLRAAADREEHDAADR